MPIMKSLTEFVTEKLKIKKSEVKTLHPKDITELKDMINMEIRQNGKECSLNHIDVSNMTSMESLFYSVEFDGDISDWDMSNVENMNGMFSGSSFTGKNSDLSGWDVSKVTSMRSAFFYCPFNGDISEWDVSNVRNFAYMFANCPHFNQDISGWDISGSRRFVSMFEGASSFYQNLSSWDLRNVPNKQNVQATNMFAKCKMSRKKIWKPKGIV